eukprot:2072803-Pleurochrysis_carterae.AAC.1
MRSRISVTHSACTPACGRICRRDRRICTCDCRICKRDRRAVALVRAARHAGMDRLHREVQLRRHLRVGARAPTP